MPTRFGDTALSMGRTRSGSFGSWMPSRSMANLSTSPVVVPT